MTGYPCGCQAAICKMTRNLVGIVYGILKMSKKSLRLMEAFVISDDGDGNPTNGKQLLPSQQMPTITYSKGIRLPCLALMV